MQVGDEAPEFTLRDGNGKNWSLRDHRGRVVALLFYPGDDTPVCTAQLCSLRDRWAEYRATGAEIIGLSTDSEASHKRFAAKHSLPLRLLADAKGEASRLYGMKSWIPGRAARGVVVIDRNGKIAYRKAQFSSLFRPRDAEVLAAIRAATQGN